MALELSETERIQVLMIVGYGDRKRTQREVCQLFNELHPNRPQITQSCVSKLLKKFNETGSVKDKLHTGRPKTATDDDTSLNVLLSIQENPHLSSREVGRVHAISHRSVLKQLHKEKFHPYKMQLVQELVQDDFEKRVEFCNTMLEKFNMDLEFGKKIVFTDEATFMLHGFYNKQNYRYWCQENPHWIRETRTQRPEKINVWTGILGNNIIGPFFIDGNLTADKYLNLLREQIVPALETLGPIHQMWFQQDGAPPHYGRAVREYLNEMFPERWIGRGGAIKWPARSPDFNPCDYFLWGYLKSIVYRERPVDLEDLKARIRIELRQIRHHTLASLSDSFLNRVRMCLNNNGRHFEHLMN